MGIIVFFEFLGAIGYILTKEDLRRSKYEHKSGPTKSFAEAKVAPEFDSEPTSEQNEPIIDSASSTENLDTNA